MGLELRDQPALHRHGAEIASRVRRRRDQHQAGGLGRSRCIRSDLPIAAAQIKACLDGDSDVYDIEHRMLHKDGSVRWFLSRGSAIRAEDGTVRRIVGTKVDITELKGAEQAIRDNEAKLPGQQ